MFKPDAIKLSHSADVDIILSNIFWGSQANKLRQFKFDSTDSSQLNSRKTSETLIMMKFRISLLDFDEPFHLKIMIYENWI